MSFPALHGNWVDFIIILVLIFYILEGWGRGFLRGLIDFTGFLASLLSALKFYAFGAELLISNFSLPRGISNAAGFLLIALTSELLYSIIVIYGFSFIKTQVAFPRIRMFRPEKINVALGFMPPLLSGLVLLAFLLTTLITLPIQPGIKQSIVSSKIGGFLTRETSGLELSLTKIFGGAAEETLNFITIRPQSRETVDLNFRTREFSVDRVSEQKMLGLVNSQRSQDDLTTIIENAALLEVARDHCKDMFKRGYFSHYTPEDLSPFDRMEQAGIDYQTAGENLAYAPTVEIAHQGLMNNPGHRKNILSSDFGKLGAGVIDGGIYGKMFCQEFTD